MIGENYYDFVPKTRILYKIASNGTILWTQNLTSSAHTGAATSESGWIIAGEMKISENNHSSLEKYLVKLERDGTIQWTQTYGTIKNSLSQSIEIQENYGQNIEIQEQTTTRTSPSGAPVISLVAIIVVLDFRKRRKYCLFKKQM